MGTETLISFKVFIINYPFVKLNNPLMGTETEFFNVQIVFAISIVC